MIISEWLIIGYVMMIFKVTKDLSKQISYNFQSPRKIKKRQENFLAGLERESDKKFLTFNSGIKAQTIYRRGEVLHSFLHAGRESEYNFAWNSDKGAATNTRKFIDRLAPDMFRPYADFFELNNMVGDKLRRYIFIIVFFQIFKFRSVLAAVHQNDFVIYKAF